MLNAMKCPVTNFSVEVVLRLGFVPSRSSVRTTLYDLNCTYFSPQVMVTFARRAKAHFVTPQ